MKERFQSIEKLLLTVIEQRMREQRCVRTKEAAR